MKLSMVQNYLIEHINTLPIQIQIINLNYWYF